jgi:hypothetical protein
MPHEEHRHDKGHPHNEESHCAGFYMFVFYQWVNLAK